MHRLARLCLVPALAVGACSPGRERSANDRSLARRSHAPSDAEQRIARPLGPPLPGMSVRIGPYALITDSAALERLWPKESGAPPSLDFQTSALLALRLYATVPETLAAPRVLSRRGVTFVVLRPHAGPLHPDGSDRIVFYRIPLDGGPVRYIAYQ